MSDFNNIKWSPNEYQQAAFLAQQAQMEMLSRLDLMMIKPELIVDAGCGLGELAVMLAQRFPDAKVVGVDTSAAMIDAASQHQNVEWRCEDAAKISCPDHAVDLICANFLLPWVADADACLREWRRVLKPNGLLMLSVPGVGTLREIKQNLPQHALPSMVDMHDLGDALVSAGFADPVLDACDIDLRYREISRMQQELHACGMLAADVLLADLTTQVTVEIVHAHAFTPQPADSFKTDADGAVRIPLSHLRKSLV